MITREGLPDIVTGSPILSKKRSKDNSNKKKKAKSISPTKKPKMTMIQELSIKTKTQSPIISNTTVNIECPKCFTQIPLTQGKNFVL